MTLLLILLLAPDFVNVAEEVGLAGCDSNRAVFVDLDADGRLDVVLNRRHFFFQRDGKFVPAPPLQVFPDLVLFADFDNDGDQDCFAGWSCEPDNPDWVKKKDQGQKNALYINLGQGIWTEQSLDMPRTAAIAACAFDYDRDGNLDLFVGSSYVVYGRGLEAGPDRLYKGDGKGGFKDVTKALGLLTRPEPGGPTSSRPTYGVTHGDFNGDGWQDIWVETYGRQWNRLWVSEKGKHFTDLGPRTGFDGDSDRSGHYPKWLQEFWKKRYGGPRQDEMPFRANGNTFDCAIADFDNDGDMDCLLSEITHEWAGPSSDRTSLLINTGDRFERHPEAFAREHTGPGRWNQGDIFCGWIDFDNDGRLDALIASSDYPDNQQLKLYRQKPDHTFEKARLFGWEGAGQISVGDFDNDGDQDILVGRSLNRLSKEKRKALGPSCALFRNEIGNRNHWLQVVCRGKTANRDGIGCRISVTTPDHVTQTREIRGGHGHAGHNDPYIAHFGLGSQTTARVVVRWPDAKGSRTVKEKVAAGQRLLIEQ